MLSFDFLDKGLEIVSPAHFVGSICIAIVCYPGCDVLDFEIKLIFLIEPFFLHEQKVMTKT